MPYATARFVLPVVMLSLLHLWLARGQTLMALGRAGHDDQLLRSLAQHIAGGHWLGPFNNPTLAKGPFYPMWIAASFILGDVNFYIGSGQYGMVEISHLALCHAILDLHVGWERS